MKKYNLFILLPNLTDEEIKNAIIDIRQEIKKSGGSVEKFNDWGKRKLSYAVKNVKHGYYLNFVISLEATNRGILEKELKLKDYVLRFDFSKDIQAILKKQETKKAEQKFKGIKEKVSMKDLNEKLDNLLLEEEKV